MARPKSAPCSAASGVPLAYFFARTEFWGKGLLETLAVDVPQTFPPVAEGMIFLLMLGPKSPFHVNLAFTFTALVIAKFYISTPFVVSYTARRFREIEKTGIKSSAKLPVLDLQNLVDRGKHSDLRSQGVKTSAERARRFSLGFDRLALRINA